MKKLVLRARRATPAVLDDMQRRGLLKRLVPSEKCLRVPEGEQVVERVELGAPGTGPWQMLAVACNRTRLTYLACHSDIESWLYWSAEPTSKPLLYVVATCPFEEFREKAAGGRLGPDDFLALEIHPNDGATSYFTVPANVLHDELTYAGPGVAPVFFVPEGSVMEHQRVPLDGYDVEVVRAG